MSNFEIKNIIMGGETPIKKVEPKIITPEVLGENGEVLQDAVYDEGGYDTDLELPIIPEGDEAYFVTATIFIKSNNANFPDFQKVVKIISLNSMNGFEVDAQREKFLSDYIANLNKM